MTARRIEYTNVTDPLIAYQARPDASTTGSHHAM
jgi:hypothetical protein